MTGGGDETDGRALLTGCGDTVRAMADLAPLGFISPRHETALRDLRTLANSVARTLRRGDSAETADAAEKLGAAIAQAQRLAVADLHEYGATSFSGFFNLWEQTLDIELEPTRRGCPYCRRQLSAMYGKHFSYGRVARAAEVCNRCGPVRDMPSDRQVRDILLHCPPRWDLGSTVDIDVAIESMPGLAVPATGWLAVHTSGASRLGLRFTSPREVHVDGASPQVLRLTAEIGAAAYPHQHFLRAVLMLRGRVHYASRSVAIQPA